jgi:hypothetical protein
MDPFSGRASHSGRNHGDAPFHCSPAIAPEDVICGGSDTEETEDEILRKRLRYEDQARRCMNGHLPVLQSTNLRGPLTKESGWLNPWRYQELEKQSWWRPGAKDMMFTKQDVMKRAADHGLGHLSPADALAWCKSTAAAKAKSTARTGPRAFNLKSSPMREDSEEVPSDSNEKEGFPGQAGILDDKLTLYGYNEDKAEDGMGSRDTKEGIRGIKRAVDSKWLKGSYVSKRARWDGPAISTPTPMPDLHGNRDRRRKSRLAEIGRSQPAAHLGSSLEDKLQAETPKPSEKTAPAKVHTTRPQPKQRTPSTRVCSAPDAQPRTWNISHSGMRQQEVEYMDEFQEVSTSAFGRDSRPDSVKTTYVAEHYPYTSIEPEALASLPPSRKRHLQTPATDSISRQASSAAAFSNTLPKLPRPTGTPKCQKHRSEPSEEDVSFVTEVAPSSHNVEKFQFRKKRTKPQQTAAVQPPEPDEPDSIQAPTVREPSEENDDYIHVGIATAPQLDNFNFDSQSNADITTPFTTQNTNPPISEISTSRYNERADMSLFQTPYSPRVLADPPLLPKLANFTSLFSQDGLGMESPEPGKIAPMIQHSSNPSARSSQALPSHTLPGPSTKVLKSPVPVNAAPGDSKALMPCDSSTQSYNMTPIRSGRSLNSSPKPPTQSQAREEIDIPIEEIQYQTKDEADLQDDEIRDDIALGDAAVRDEGPFNEAVPNQQILHQQLLAEQALDQQVLDQQVLDQQDLDQRVLAQQHHSEGVPSEAASPEKIQIEEVTVEENQPEQEHEHEEVRDENKASSGDNIDEDETASEDSLDEKTEDEDLESQPDLDSEDDTQSDSNRSSENSPDAGSPLVENGLSSGNTAQKAPTPQVTIAESSVQPPSHTGIYDSVPARPIAPEANAPKTPKVASQVIRSGEQSPWTTVAMGPLPKAIPLASTDPIEDDVSTSSYEIVPQPGASESPQLGSHVEELDWHHVERSPTPHEEDITPFKDIMTPPSPARRSQSIEEDLPSTQLLFEAALNNPWTSKTTTSGKSKKRVSFGVLLSERDENDEVSPFPKRIPGSPPPPEPVDLFEEDSFDESTIVVSFGDHFNAARKQRLIPETTDSQINRSPAVIAQAQAFVAADQEAPLEQVHHRTLSVEPSRHLNLGSEAMDHSVWQDSEREDTSFEQSLFVSPKGNLSGFNAAMSKFDMDDVLGDAGDFLEDWSVDAELKKAKDVDLSKDFESNGAKRRRLFGIV